MITTVKCVTTMIISPDERCVHKKHRGARNYCNVRFKEHDDFLNRTGQPLHIFRHKDWRKEKK